MNKKKISLALIAVFAFASLAGCAKESDSKPSDVTVSSMKLNSGFPTAYMTGATIDWSTVSVTVSYSNSNTATFTGSDVEFDVETPAEATRLVVYTDGLHAQATAQEGEYNLKASLAGKSEKHDLAKVVVGKIVPSKYELTSFDLPEFVDTYKATISHAGQDGEENFYNADEIFTVGTLNAFEFEPVATFRNKDTRVIVPSTNYRKTTVVKVKQDSTYVDASTSDYTVVSNGVKFADSAAGKQFKISVYPEEFETIFGEPVLPAEMEFKVERGFNVYTAKQLGILNVTEHNAEYFYDHPFTHHLGIKNGSTKDNDCDDVYWNGETYVRLDTTALWRKFLKDSGTFTEEEMNQIHDVPGVFLMDSISITKDDMPSEFFVVDGETGNTGANHDGRTGSLRDAVNIYHPLIDGHDVVVNGNYFTLNTSSISLCNSTWKNGLTCYTDEDTAVDPGHSSLFKFCGPDANNYGETQVDTANGKIGIVKNINSVGNTKKNPEGSDILQVTGLIFAKNKYAGAKYTNNVIKQYQIGLFPDNHVGQTVNQDDDPENNYYNTRIQYCKVYDCSNCGICNYQNGGIYVSDCAFNRYGGAPILNAGSQYATYSGIVFFGANIEYNNFITGGEVYFTAVGAASQFSTLTGFNLAFNAYGKSITKDGKMNLVSLNMDGAGYVGSSHKTYYSDVYLNYHQDNQLVCSIGGATEELYNKAWEVYKGTGYAAPTFATETGCLFYFDGSGFIDPTLNEGAGGTQGPISGEYVSILLPVGSTTLNATFRLYDYVPA